MTKMMTAKEVAEYLNINVQTVYRKKENGELPFYRIGKSIRFKKSQIDEATEGGKNAKNDGTRRYRSNLANSF